MKKHLNVGLASTLSLANRFPARRAKTDAVSALVKKLHPWKTDKELIRLGPQGDGGYLVPDDLEEIPACFSPGVSTLSGFEKDCANRGMQVFLADKSVEGPAEEHERFDFTKKFVGATSSTDVMTLDEWVSESAVDADSDLLLQMDIEGCEYEALLAASDNLLRRFRIIVVEFHFLDQLWSAPFLSVARPTFEKLLQTHCCVHIHPNNCTPAIKMAGVEVPPVMEFTFLRSDRIEQKTPQKSFPHPLDFDNTTKPQMSLPGCWYVA